MSRHAQLRATVFGLCLLVTAVAVPAAEGRDDRQRDRAAISRLLAEWEAAWNAHDMRRLAALFREDAVWVLWTGDVWTGRARFEQGMTEVHKTVYRASVQREQLEELTFVGPDAAVLRFRSVLTGDTRYPDRTINSRKILVVTRRNNGWLIGWGQNTRFLADIQPTAPQK